MTKFGVGDIVRLDIDDRSPKYVILNVTRTGYIVHELDMTLPGCRSSRRHCWEVPFHAEIYKTGIEEKFTVLESFLFQVVCEFPSTSVNWPMFIRESSSYIQTLALCAAIRRLDVDKMVKKFWNDYGFDYLDEDFKKVYEQGINDALKALWPFRHDEKEFDEREMIGY